MVSSGVEPQEQAVYAGDAFGRASAGQSLHPGGQDLSERMLSLCHLKAGVRVLDMACGTAGTVEMLQAGGDLFPIGIDHSMLMLQTGLTRKGGLPLACGWGRAIPLADECLEAALAECSFSTMAEPEAVLEEFRRVLRPGGRLALSDIYAREPQGLPALHALPMCCGLRNALGRDELESLLQRHGFEIEVWEEQSPALLEFSRQAVLAHGSASELWRQAEPAADAMDVIIAIHNARLGYYLLVARKV